MVGRSESLPITINTAGSFISAPVEVKIKPYLPRRRGDAEKAKNGKQGRNNQKKFPLHFEVFGLNPV
jgi:hypothetical protein